MRHSAHMDAAAWALALSISAFLVAGAGGWIGWRAGRALRGTRIEVSSLRAALQVLREFVGSVESDLETALEELEESLSHVNGRTWVRRLRRPSSRSANSGIG